MLNTLKWYSIALLAIITFYIISMLIIKAKKKVEDSEVHNFIIEKIAELIILIQIPILIVIHYLFYSTISLYIAAALGIALLFMENKININKLQLLKEIERDEKIDNLTKISTKLFINVLPFVLSIVIAYSLIFLTIFPLNTTLINIILTIMPVYTLILIIGNMFIPFAIYIYIKNKNNNVIKENI